MESSIPAVDFADQDLGKFGEEGALRFALILALPISIEQFKRTEAAATYEMPRGGEGNSSSG